MTDQIPMFIINPDMATPVDSTRPTCPSCRLRPVSLDSRGQFRRFCGPGNCSNHQRKCANCGTVYQRDGERAGNKYCSTECKRAGYTVALTSSTHNPSAPCRMCNLPTTARFNICPECKGSQPWIRSLMTHNAPDWAWEHMTLHGTCMNPGCSVDIAGTTWRDGKYRAKVHVDHDHACCAKATSCGKCIRGLLCSACNTALGMLRDDPGRISGLALYAEMSSTTRDDG